ncbi:MAG: hypothetical protein GXY59_02525 [Bacteroidales bacterium]|nr:hypothetical protein [Bacteroidales bacterium]
MKKEQVTTSASMLIGEPVIAQTIKALTEKHGDAASFRIDRGVRQAASLWRETDGNAADFEKFCTDQFVAGAPELEALYKKLERNLEIFSGYFHKMDVLLKEPLQLDGPEPGPVDLMFGSYDASAHLTDDFFANKIAFLTALNFPFYSLKEKTELGEKWSRLEWAYARMGDRFTSRVPADIIQNVSQTLTAADTYISGYNILMDKLVDSTGTALFPAGLKLITHWGLRDELKSDYAGENGLAKQRMIYQVMQRIIDQSIPQEVINKGEVTWDPYANKIFREGAEVNATPEPDKRYEVLLANFRALQKMDAYTPHYPTYITRAFEEGMEIPQQDVEKLFTDLVSSPTVKEVAALISQRLGRPLEPFDIWYNGFKAAGGIPEEQLTALTTKKYPDTEAVRKDLPVIMQKLGWAPAEAQRISALITVDASRGAGHAWGAGMKNDLAHLRTRVGTAGMDYKGYNIAVHEFGHCVEQTITMNDVDYFMLNGVPNTAFTEAVAFLFQKRDLELLGVKGDNPMKGHLMALDNFWACYEIMGVSLVDMKVWKWLYDNPDATPAQLKEAVITTAKEVWNQYYAGVLGGNDEPLLAIYSHMIDNPLYLSNYPVGHLIDFQIEQQVTGKNLAGEITRMLVQGRIVPQLWMKGAVGHEISIQPTLEATGKALEAMRM